MVNKSFFETVVSQVVKKFALSMVPENSGSSSKSDTPI
jgi:hypothetical protein